MPRAATVKPDTSMPTPLLLEQAMLDPATLIPAPGNPRVHADALLRSGMQRFGLYRAVIVNKPTGQLVAGHGTVEAFMAEKPGDPIQVSYIDVDEETARRILIWDNRTSDLASNDERLLAEFLSALPDLDFTGYDPGDLQTLIDSLPDIRDPKDGDNDGEGQPDEEPTPEDYIALAGVVVGEPPITAKTGDVWQLGKHHLVVADVHSDWHLYTHLLRPGCLFWPYPTLLAPFADKALETPVVMVQPSTYLAGWLLTKWQRVTGNDPDLIAGKGAVK